MQPSLHDSGTYIQTAISYVVKNEAKHLDELKSFLRIPSVSTKPEHDADVKRAAKWLAQKLESIEMENAEVVGTDGHPLVYADWLHAGNHRPTLLLYGHYDVQPPEPLELWDSPPFEPILEDDYLYARGASDDKGQMYILIRSLEAYLKTTGTLPLNVKCIFEGEEETNGASLAKFVSDNKERLSADYALISDTAMKGNDRPSIVSGLRGICYILLDVLGPDRDLHSGLYGGIIDNPLNVLGHLIAKLKSEDGHVRVPGFYNKVRPIEETERRLLSEGEIDEADWLQRTGAPAIWGEPGFSIAERIGIRPTLDVNGLRGGYTGTGMKTVLPSSGHAKISMRLVPDQDPFEIYALFKAYISSVIPKTVRVKSTLVHAGRPAVLSYDSQAMRAARKAVESVFGQPPTLVREGGSIPIVEVFKERLGIESVLLGFGLPDDRIHSPNERFYLPNFSKGTETIIRFLYRYSMMDQ